MLAFIGMDLYFLSLLLFNLLMGRMYSLKPRLYAFDLLLYFLVYSGSYFDDDVECKEDSCFYSMCWNASMFSLAIVTRMPRLLSWPVQASSVMTLFRPKEILG